MCGILGIISGDARLAGHGVPRGWDAAMREISSRGPDGHGVWRCATGRAILGHARLAIQDRSDAAAQPMLSERGAAITFNGEIVNAPALRRELQSRGCVFRTHSDTEVLLHAYHEWGPRGMLPKLHGMYALVIWDRASRTAFAAVDHLSIKPLYWSLIGGVLSFASTADALRCVLEPVPEIEPLALAHVLSTGYVPAPLSVWRGVRKMEPGRAMIWSEGAGAATWRHWSPPECAGMGTSDPDDGSLAGVLDDVLRDHMLSDVPVGVLLSGGIDSTAIAWRLARLGFVPECLTLSLPGADDESPTAAATARALSLPHRSVRLDADDARDALIDTAGVFDEPQGFGALLTMTRVARAARERWAVALSGDGGDEAFGGYPWHRTPTAVAPSERDAAHGALARRTARPEATAAERDAAMSALALKSPTAAYLQAVMPRFHPAEAEALLAPLGVRFGVSEYTSWIEPEDRAALPAPRRAQRLDLAGFCPGSILPKVDRAAMAVGLEVRPPMLDRRVLEWALARSPASHEGPAESQKPALRRLLRASPVSGVLSRPKQGFSLRLGRNDVWSSMLDDVERSAFARGCLTPRWREYLAPGVPNREGKAFALCFLAAWAERRNTSAGDGPSLESRAGARAEAA